MLEWSCLMEAWELFGQGMAGIFVVLGSLAALIRLIQWVDRWLEQRKK